MFSSGPDEGSVIRLRSWKMQSSGIIVSFVPSVLVIRPIVVLVCLSSCYDFLCKQISQSFISLVCRAYNMFV